jgi:hypothetical protein
MSPKRWKELAPAQGVDVAGPKGKPATLKAPNI